MNAVTASPDLDAAVATIEQHAATPHMITVPATSLPNGTVVPEFQVSQFLASQGADGLATASAELAPWVRINYTDAVAACQAIGRQLLTETRALAIAINLAGVAANWTGGAVGVGKLKQGLRKGSVSRAQPGSYASPDADEDRWLVLSNGERICDHTGNAYSWIFDDVQGNAIGLVDKEFAADSPSVTAVAACGAAGKGAGWIPEAGWDWSGHALLRGGCWYSEDNAGVFRLGGVSPDYARGLVGFRYTN